MTAHRPGRRAALLAAALVGLATALAACGDADNGPTVATAATANPTPAASPTSDAVARYLDAQRAWVRCLREQGYPDVPDPDARGRVAIDGETNRRLKTKGLGVLEKCQEHLAGVDLPAELADKPEPVTPERLARMREYAQCMRDNGRPSWPDPHPNGEWPDLGAPEMSPQEQRANELALQICDPIFDGRPPTTPDPNRTAQG